MCSRCLACCPNHLRGADVGEEDSRFKDNRSLAHIIYTCRMSKQTAEADFFSQVEAQRKKKKEKCLMLACVLFFYLPFTFLMESVGKEDTNAQDYDADVSVPSKAFGLLGCLLFWTLWLLLHLLQMFLWLIKGLLWFIAIAASPLCCCASFLLSCVLLLLHYMCNAVYFATACPVYVYGMLLSVVIALYIFTRWKPKLSHLK